MITIDGSFGEGGGQIIRTSLGLSLVTGKPFRIDKIRAKRKNPGLQKQHLMSVLASAEIGNADVTGATLNSQEITFTPKEIKHGEFDFDIGTAGSTSLVFQTVLPALIVSDKETKLTIRGGTHNPLAPPFDFLTKTFLPLLEKMGIKIEVELIRYGFYPSGGGEVNFKIPSTNKLRPIHINERGKQISQSATALIANLPLHIAERELNVVRRSLDWDEKDLKSEVVKNVRDSANVVSIAVEFEKLTEVFTGIGKRGKPAEEVARDTARDVKNYLKSTAPVGEYLADQLLIPFALTGSGSYTTGKLSDHTTTNIEVIKKFLDVEIKKIQVDENLWRIEIGD